MKKVLSVLIIAVITIFAVTCKKFAEPETYVEPEAPVVPPTSNIPTVEIVEITDITTSSAKVSCKVTYDAGVTIIDRGVCWSTEHNPTFDGDHVSCGIGAGSYNIELTGFEHAVTYYITAYAINSYGTGYSEEMELTMLPFEACVTTNPVTNITYFTADCGGIVTSDGGGVISVKGVCWNTSPKPTVEDAHTEDGSGAGEFTSHLTELNPNKTYYVRAYASNEVGTVYGNDIMFSTPAGLPTVLTSSISDVTSSSATCGGNVTDEAGFPVTERGVCWGLGLGPSIAGNHTSDGSGTGVFTSSLTGLIPGKKYYVRAYATNSNGTSYGITKEFTSKLDVPTVTTYTPMMITIESAVVGGNVVSAGDAPIIERGVCWCPYTATPTINGNHIANGSEVGTFNCNINGLEANTKYKVRAYATNSCGTGYGETMVFTTEPILPIVTTGYNGGYTSMVLYVNGNVVTKEGTSPVTARGVCWCKAPDIPTVSNTHTVNGSGAGSFDAVMDGLHGGNTYNYRAYARNSAGVSYGEMKVFNAK